MKRSNKKGFTIVELVIVIAVVAILAAVLIPTFAGIVKKANLSSDTKAERDMNTALAIEQYPADLDAVIDALIDNGFNEEHLIPVSADYSFAWNKTTKKIELIKTADLTADYEDLKDLVKYIDVAAKSADDVVNAIAKKSEYIKLEEDVVIDGVLNVPADANITIDLNGKTLSAPSVTRPFNLGNGSNVVIDAEGATINCGKYGLANFDSVNATLTVNGGNFVADLDNGAFIKVRAGSGDVKVVLNDVNYVDASTDSFIVNCLGAKGKVEVVINGGEYKSAMGVQAKDITIDGATIVADAYAVIATKALTVKDATITSNGKYEYDLTGSGSMPAACVSVQSGATATVTNSTLTYNKYDAATSQGAALVVASSGGKIVVDDASTITGETYLNTVNELYNGQDSTAAYIEIAGEVKVDVEYSAGE